MKTGLLRRLIGAELGIPKRAPDIIHILPDGDADLDAIAARLARLEEGTRLIVETMKEAYGELGDSLGALRRELAEEGDDRIAQALERSLAPLLDTVSRVAEAVDSLPHVVAAATDDVIQRIDHSVAGRLGASVGAVAEARPVTLNLEEGHHLPAKPFDLEPVERQFGPASDVIKMPADPGEDLANGQDPRTGG